MEPEAFQSATPATLLDPRLSILDPSEIAVKCDDEDDLDLTYYGARFYMPEIGRFIQVDPAREFHNPYSYVGNNPVGFVDPSGELSRHPDMWKFPIHNRLSRIAEKWISKDVAFRNFVYANTPEENHLWLFMDSMYRQGATITPHNNSLNAAGTYGNGTIDIFPVDLNRMTSAGILAKNVITILHEIVHHVAAPDGFGGQEVRTELLTFNIRTKTFGLVEGNYCLGKLMDAEVFGFVATEESVTYVIENQTVLRGDDRFINFFNLLDFVSEQMGLASTDLLPTEELKDK